MNFDSVNLSLAASCFEIYHASLCESISLAAEGFYANQYFSLLKDSIMHLSILTKRLYSKTLLLDSRQLTSPRERMHLLEYLNDGKWSPSTQFVHAITIIPWSRWRYEDFLFYTIPNIWISYGIPFVSSSHISIQLLLQGLLNRNWLSMLWSCAPITLPHVWLDIKICNDSTLRLNVRRSTPTSWSRVCCQRSANFVFVYRRIYGTTSTAVVRLKIMQLEMRTVRVIYCSIAPPRRKRITFQKGARRHLKKM
jgi:hypothetical protein